MNSAQQMEELLLEFKAIRKEISDLRIIVEKIQEVTVIKKTDMPAIKGLYQYKL